MTTCDDLSAMMYFSPLKTMVIVTVCALGILFCLPNLVPARRPGCRGGRCISASTCAAAATS